VVDFDVDEIELIKLVGTVVDVGCVKVADIEVETVDDKIVIEDAIFELVVMDITKLFVVLDDSDMLFVDIELLKLENIDTETLLTDDVELEIAVVEVVALLNRPLFIELTAG